MTRPDSDNETRAAAPPVSGRPPAGRFDFRTSDPDELVETLASVAPGASISAATTGFAGRLRALRLPGLGLFEIAISAGRVLSPPRHYLSLSLPIEGDFALRERGRRKALSRKTVHALPSRAIFDLRTRDARCLVANLDESLVERFARAARAPEDWEERLERVLLRRCPQTSSLRRFVFSIWREFNSQGSLLDTPLVASELENLLAGMLVQASFADLNSRASLESTQARLRRAEDFLMAHLASPVSLADVAEAADLSIRTLTRAFRERHGVGPISFLRRQRLDAARRDLLRADPKAATVTQVALRYGFSHLSRFAGDYQQTFGELPSATLNR
jgi:AraC-like DNA-binding protein